MNKPFQRISNVRKLFCQYYFNFKYLGKIFIRICNYLKNLLNFNQACVCMCMRLHACVCMHVCAYRYVQCRYHRTFLRNC